MFGVSQLMYYESSLEKDIRNLPIENILFASLHCWYTPLSSSLLYSLLVWTHRVWIQGSFSGLSRPLSGTMLRVTTVDNSQLGNNAATRVISMLYNHSLA